MLDKTEAVTIRLRIMGLDVSKGFCLGSLACTMENSWLIRKFCPSGINVATRHFEQSGAVGHTIGQNIVGFNAIGSVQQ